MASALACEPTDADDLRAARRTARVARRSRSIPSRSTMTRSRVRGDVGLVRDHDDRLARAREVFEHAHDFFRRRRVEVTRRLVGEKDRRVVDQRARDGDALALSARELVRPVIGCDCRAARARAPAVARALRSSAGTPAYTSGSSTLCSAVARGSRLNVWKTNPISLLRTRASSSSAIVETSVSVQPVFAGVRRVEAADEVHQRRLARARRTHDRDVLVAADGEVDAAQRAHDFAAHVVLALDAARDDDPVLAPAPAGLRRVIAARSAVMLSGASSSSSVITIWLASGFFLSSAFVALTRACRP